MPRKGKRVPVAPPISPATVAWQQRHPVLAAQEAELVSERVKLQAEWKHREATAETQYKAGKTKQGALARLFQEGGIDRDQLQWASEIAAVAEYLQRDVAPHIVTYEMRIDHETRGPVSLVSEHIGRVRAEIAYKEWCRLLPNPKPMVLDMITGEAIGYTVAARRYHVHQRYARRFLIQAIDRWPTCWEWACRQVDRDDLLDAQARLG